MNNSSSQKQFFSLLPTPYSLLPTLLCITMILAFAIFFSALAVQQHRVYLTNGLDIGNVDQALWNTAQGRFLYFTLMAPVTSRLALHIEPILLLFVPFYWLNLGSPELLLIAQATIVALGAWPVYQLAITNYQYPKGTSLPITNTQKARRYPLSIIHYPLLTFPLIYLLLPTLQSAVLFDFHAVTLASTFLLFAFVALEQKNNRRFFIFAALALACKEDMPLVVAMMGLYAGLAQRRWRLAGVTMAVSALWFVVAVMVIQPYFAGGNIQLDRYAWLGSSPPEMLKTVLTQPGLVFNHLWIEANLPGYLRWLFFPTAFLALFSPLTLLPMLPTLAINLLSDNPFTWRLEDFHYGASLAPFLLISTIYGIRNITGWISKRQSLPRTPALLLIALFAALALTFTAIYHYHRGYTPLARPFQWPERTNHHQQLDSILATIPPDTPLFAQSNLAPHLSHRQTIYSEFAYFTDPNFPAPEPVQDVVLDITTLENIGGLHQFLQETLLGSGDYQLVTANDGILHFSIADSRQPTAEKNTSPPNLQSPISNLLSDLPPEFYTFTQPDLPPQYPLRADFGDALWLHGYTLHFDRQENVEVTVDLEPLRPLDTIQPVLYLLDSTGQPSGATVDLQPILVWYPVEQWTPGQTVQVRFNTLPWDTRTMQKYGLALGVITGVDAWNVDGRLRPSIPQPTKIAPRLPADGTLLELARIEQSYQMPQGGPQPRRFSPPSIPHPLDANFADQINLLGHTDVQLSIPKGHFVINYQLSIITITLYWQAIDMPEPLIRFVQLIGPDGQVYGQRDSSPDLGAYPTNLWQPGEVVVDPVTFPVQSERPAGRYTLHIGLYHPDSGERLQLQNGADHIEVPVPK